MLPLLSLGPASDALIACASDRSASEERQCRAFLALLETSDAIRHALRRELARHALTETGFNTLACLLVGASESVAPKELAARIGLSVHALETVLARLEMSGLIARAPAHSKRHLLAIKATPAGRAAFASAASHCAAAIRDAMSTISSRDLDALERSCSTLRQFSSPTESHPSHLCAMSLSAAASSRKISSSSP